MDGHDAPADERAPYPCRRNPIEHDRIVRTPHAHNAPSDRDSPRDDPRGLHLRKLRHGESADSEVQEEGSRCAAAAHAQD